MRRVGQFATLNANYLMTELRKVGFEVAFPGRRASHEFIVTLKRLKADTGVTAMDVAKRLLDKGFHAPTTYFPQLVPECLLIEPSETESKQLLLCGCHEDILRSQCCRRLSKRAPHAAPVRCLTTQAAANSSEVDAPVCGVMLRLRLRNNILCGV